MPPSIWRNSWLGWFFRTSIADQGLDLALERMGANQIEILPVVSRADVHKLEGIVTLRDVLDSYGVNMPGRA